MVEGSGTQSGPKSFVYMNSRWSYLLTGVVELPWQINFGVNVQGREGFPVPYQHGVSVQGTAKSVLIDDIGDYRLKDSFNVDLRLSKQVALLGRSGLSLSVDVFNATDERTVLQRQTRTRTGALANADGFIGTPNVAVNRIAELQSPRVFRLGARLTF